MLEYLFDEDGDKAYDHGTDEGDADDGPDSSKDGSTANENTEYQNGKQRIADAFENTQHSGISRTGG